jgi:hypothetical protein
MKNALRIQLVICALLLSACNGQVTDFVKGAIPDVALPGGGPSTSSPPGPSTVKVSPGQMRASATNGSVVANVTATNQVLKSADISAKVGISRNRVSTQ